MPLPAIGAALGAIVRGAAVIGRAALRGAGRLATSLASGRGLWASLRGGARAHATGKYISRTRDFEKRVREQHMKGLEACLKHLVTQLKQQIDTPWPPPSIPGESPHKRTGRGQQSISYILDPNDLSGRIVIYPDGQHLVLLEQGTRFIEARPWIAPVLEREGPTLQRIYRSHMQEVTR